MDRRIIIAGALLVVGVTCAAAWQSYQSTNRTLPNPNTVSFNTNQDFSTQEPMPKKTDFAQDKNPLANVKEVPFDSERAMKYLKTLCDIGARISGTDGIKKQQEIMIKHFEDLGGKVTKQTFEAKQKSRKDKIPFTNIIVSWYPEKTRRVILCCHYDTRPIADQENDKRNWNKPFVSANDGTAGVAMLMELAHHMKVMSPNLGIDFVFFDGEEYVFETNPITGDDYFIGSEYFAKDYTANRSKLKFTYEAALLFDLCCHENAVLRVESHSYQFAGPIVNQVWEVAKHIEAKSFRYERGDDVRDDHLALNAAKIPAVDIIEFGYQHWHKLTDTPDKISPKQMAEVMKVVTTWVQLIK
jgi:glutaminyl-peptide cyclotransferase